jgi:tetraacyldisaccharide 4'-kinase
VRWRWRDGLEHLIERLWYGPKGWLYALMFLPLGALTPISRLASYRRRRHRAAAAPLPLIGVGNLVAGGSGKTQVVLVLAQRAIDRGLRPAILTRGYGARLTSTVRVATDARSALVGDEACLLAKRLPGALVFAGPDRLSSAVLARQMDAPLAILDDGLQQGRVEVERKVWVVAAEMPFGNGRLLPLGPMRDPPRTIAPSDLVWVHGEGTPPPGLRVDITSRSEPLGLVSAFELTGPLTAARGMAVAVFCGIARPHRFLASLSELGADVRRFWARGDHRTFDPPELMRAAEQAKAAGAVALVCTEKDAVRLPAVRLPLPVLALRVELRILSGEQRVDELLAQR